LETVEFIFVCRRHSECACLTIYLETIDHHLKPKLLARLGIYRLGGGFGCINWIAGVAGSGGHSSPAGVGLQKFAAIMDPSLHGLASW